MNSNGKGTNPSRQEKGPRTETLIQRGMDKLMEGRIIERGNHQLLIQQKGRSYQLYTGMFELE